MSNAVSLIGNIGKEPELRYTPNGKAVCKFSIAVERVWFKEGEKQKETSWFNVQTWGGLAENVAESLPKGSRVIVVGRLELQEWETPEGDKRSAVQINAEAVGPSLQYASAKVTRNSKGND